jgi:hypothetical protein
MQIDNVSPQAFEDLKAKLTNKHQANVSGTKAGGVTTGQIMGHGVVANYTYTPTSKILTVDVQHHPFYIPVSAIESQLRAAVAAEPVAA